MNALAVLSVVVCLDAAVSAQGVVNFSNSPSALGGDGAPVSDADGTRLVGTNFYARLYGGPNIHGLEPGSEPVTFRAGPGAGFFQSTLGVISNVIPGEIAAVRIMVWDARYDSWLAAAKAGAKWTASPDLNVRTDSLDVPGPPSNLIGLQPFSIRLPTTHLSYTSASGSLILQWDWTARSCGLQCSDALFPLETWEAVADAQVTVAGTFSVLLPVGDRRRFYRVRFDD
jgi:hypothetical protein